MSIHKIQKFSLEIPHPIIPFPRFQSQKFIGLSPQKAVLKECAEVGNITYISF